MCMFYTSKTIKLMPCPYRRASQANTTTAWESNIHQNYRRGRGGKKYWRLYAFRNSTKRLVLPISTIDICILMILSPNFGLK
jgi:hypothetical protein